MKKHFFTALALLALQSLPATALTVEAGDVIRGSYSFPTLGSPTLDPTAFTLRTSSPDLFGNGDAVTIRYLDSALTPLTSSTFVSTGTALDPTVGIVFDPGDVLPPATTAAVPGTGFVEIEALAGSFDVLALDLFALEPVGSTSTLRRTSVNDFEPVDMPVAPVPLPATGLLLLLALTGALGLRRPASNRPA